MASAIKAMFTYQDFLTIYEHQVFGMIGLDIIILDTFDKIKNMKDDIIILDTLLNPPIYNNRFILSNPAYLAKNKMFN